MQLTTSNIVANTIQVAQLSINNNNVMDTLSLGNVTITTNSITVGNVSITPAGISTPTLIVGGTGYQGEQVAGIIDYQEFTATGTWYNPYNNAAANASLTGNEQVFVMLWGGGGSTQAGGGAKLGGGGAFNMGTFSVANLNSTETVTVGVGGQVATGQNGTPSVFKGLTAYGGGVGLTGAQGGGGGGVLGPSPSNGVGGPPLGGASGNSTGLGGGISTFGGGGSNGGISIFGGGGGQRASNDLAGNSVYGGAGGVDGASGVASSVSIFGGNGANSSTAAGIPGGGGGVSPNGNGARGEVRVWTFGRGATTTGTPTYALTANTTSVYETQSVLYTVSTTNIANGSTLYYTLNNSSTATSADFTTAVNGSVIINGGTGTFTLTANNDADATNESFQMDIRTGSSTGTIVASNNSVSIVPRPDSSYLAAYDQSLGSSQWTISNANLGTAFPGRIIVVCIAAENGGNGTAITSATINGVAATVAIEQYEGTGNSGYNGIIYAVVPNGTTGNIVINFNTSKNSVGAGVFALYGMGSTHTDTKNSGFNSASSFSVTPVVGTNGIVIAAFSNRNPTTATVTGATKRYDGIGNADVQYSGADATASGTITYSLAVAGKANLLSVSFTGA